MRILYIEDNPVAIRTVQRITAMIKYDLLVAMNGTDALAMLDQSLDVIVTDMMLPDYEGVQLIREIRKQLPLIPIIAVSGFPTPDEKEECRQSGCSEYLGKPYEFSEMIELLRRYAEAPPTL